MPGVKHSKRTRTRFISEFRRLGTVLQAAAAVGIDRGLHYDWLRKHPDYAEAFAEAAEPVAGLILDEVTMRGITGWDEPVFSGGKRALDFVLDEKGQPVLGADGKMKAVPAVIRRKSDACLLALAAARVPGFAQRGAVRGSAKTDDDGRLEVTVEYTDKTIPE